jgi:hypothetical protein
VGIISSQDSRIKNKEDGSQQWSEIGRPKSTEGMLVWSQKMHFIVRVGLAASQKNMLTA